jgi:O-antigen/teichoic acid export membrane protein
MYGNRYLDAIPAIETILALSGLSLVINGISAFQTVVDLQSDRIRITVAALSVNALLGLLLIPRYGLVGAVTTYGCTRVTELAISIFYLRRCTTGRLPAASMSRLFLVGILATTLAWLATTIIPGHYGFILGMMVFLLTYGPVSLLITYWTNEDFQLISMIAAHLGSPGRWLMRGINKLRCLQMKSFS